METVEATRCPMTNTEIGKAIDLSDAMVSRIRAGKRLPSIETMIRVEAVYRWKLDRQCRAWKDGDYAEKFEAILWGVE